MPFSIEVVNRIVALLIICVLGFSGIVQADNGSVLGSLQVVNTATITSKGATFDLRNTEYAYFSGDLLTTSADGSATLQLEQGYALFGADTAAVLALEKGTYQIEIREGSTKLGFREGADFIVRAGDSVIEPAQGAYRKVAAGQAAVEVAVAVKQGVPTIYVQSGQVTVKGGTSGHFQTIAAGEMYTVGRSDGLLKRVADLKNPDADAAIDTGVFYAWAITAVVLPFLEGDPDSANRN